MLSASWTANASTFFVSSARGRSGDVLTGSRARVVAEEFITKFAHIDPDRLAEIHQGLVGFAQHPEQHMFGRNLMTRRADRLIAGKKERPTDVFVKSFEHFLTIRTAGARRKIRSHLRAISSLWVTIIDVRPTFK